MTLLVKLKRGSKRDGGTTRGDSERTYIHFESVQCYVNATCRTKLVCIRKNKHIIK